jgi:hypothetical protein
VKRAVLRRHGGSLLTTGEASTRELLATATARLQTLRRQLRPLLMSVVFVTLPILL